MRILLITNILLFLISPLAARLRVVTTLPVFASIAKYVGGDKVYVAALSSGRKNPHHLTARPSYVYKLARADVFIEAGLDLEKGWTEPLLASAGNRKIMKNGSGYVVTYRGIKILEIPDRKVDRSWGDIHILGNPHYHMDPINGIIIARNIKNIFVRLDLKNAAYYNANYRKFLREIKKLTIYYLRKFKPYFGAKVVVYHRDWVYLCRRFRLTETATIEEKLGIEPSMGYVDKLISLLKIKKPKLILVAPFNPEKYARYISRKTGVPYLVLPTDVNGIAGIRSYKQMLKYNLDKIFSIISK